MPPAAAGLVPGLATQTDVTAAFGVTETITDASLGGDAMARYGNEPTTRIQLAAKDPMVSRVGAL